MNHALRFLPCVLLVMLFTPSLPQAGAATAEFVALDEKWRHYQSPHFELFSRLSDRDSRVLLHELELVRAVFFETFRLAEQAPLGVTIYAFGSRREFDAYCPESLTGVTGLYVARADRAVILLSPGSSEAGDRRTVFHEYIHHLIRVTGLHPPMWLNEGLAEIFSTLQLKSDSAVIGHPIPNHVALLKANTLMPLRALLTAEQAQVFANGDRHTGLFYAQSWALLHYWYFGIGGPKGERVTALLNKLLASPSSYTIDQLATAFEHATGENFSGMADRLDDYIRGGRYMARRAALPKIPDRNTYTQESVARDLIRERLAELLFRTRRDPRGKFVMFDALKGPGRIRALEVLGSDALIEGDRGLACERWEEAINAGTRNPAIFHQFGIIESQGWFQQFDYYFRLPPERAERLRSFLLRSIEVAPDQADAYEMLVWVEAAAPQPFIPNVNLVQAKFNSLRRKDRTLLGLAMVRIRVGDLDTARQMLDDVSHFSPEQAALDSVRRIRAVIDPAAKSGSPDSPAKAADGPEPRRPTINLQLPPTLLKQ